MFVPEHWAQVMRFQRLHSGTHEFNKRDQRALTGVMSHFGRSTIFVALALKLSPNLVADREELDKRGFTAANNSREVAAVIEAAIKELYSAVDCSVKVLRAIYQEDTRGFRNSTRSLFQGVRRLEGAFPGELKDLVESASWYKELLYLRDELTHLDTGDVTLDSDGENVTYIHYGLTRDDRPFVVEDICDWLETMTDGVRGFLDSTFEYLNTQLADQPVWAMCGMVEGRALHRWVRPVGDLDFNSGECGAWTWFEEPRNPSCPFHEHCGAYKTKAPADGYPTDRLSEARP